MLFSNPLHAVRWWTTLASPVGSAEAPHVQCTPPSESLHTPAGIEIPEEVIRQLREALGTPAAWLHQGQLRDALHSYLEDGTVFDEPDGDHFADMLHLSPSEAAAARPIPQAGRAHHTVRDRNTFVAKLLSEREQADETQTRDALS